MKIINPAPPKTTAGGDAMRGGAELLFWAPGNGSIWECTDREPQEIIVISPLKTSLWLLDIRCLRAPRLSESLVLKSSHGVPRFFLVRLSVLCPRQTLNRIHCQILVLWRLAKMYCRNSEYFSLSNLNFLLNKYVYLSRHIRLHWTQRHNNRLYAG